MQKYNLQEFIPQGLRIAFITRESYDFFRQHKLWAGIFRHKWIVLVTVVLSAFFTYFLFTELYELVFNLIQEDDQASDAADSGIASKIAKLGTNILGGSKFLLLIVMEIVIFHFSVKTLEILNQEKYETTFGMFIKAELRMIKVMLRIAIKSFIIQILLNVVLSILGIDQLVPLLMFIVNSYFIGFAFFDNYNEQQQLNIKESDLCIRKHSGAATTLGIFASVGLLIPFFGALLVPIFGAITANIYGFRHHIEFANQGEPELTIPEPSEVEP